MIHPYISERYSSRAISGKEIDKLKITDLFEAARWSPSSRNEQPWRFIYAVQSEPEEYSKLLSILNESNRIWAQNAYLLILAIAKLDSDYSIQLNRAAFYDLGGAVANLTVQAVSEGLLVHQIGGFNTLNAREIFSIPDNYEPVTVLAVGYKGSIEDLPENLRQRETAVRVRKNLDDLVFTDSFGYKSGNDLEESKIETVEVKNN